MSFACEYCSSSIAEGEMKCVNCGAPVVRDAAAPRDFHSCPFCRRRLLTLGSPACNYCGRRLPDEYIRAREADLKRITTAKLVEGTGEVGHKVDELIRLTAERKRGLFSSPLGLVDIASLIDLFR